MWKKKERQWYVPEKEEAKTESVKTIALIQICSCLRQIPCETLTLICGEAGTNAQSTVSKQREKNK